jgi:hypothetical protein
VKFIKSKKAVVLLAVMVAAVVAAVAGYAYWTTTGGGTGAQANASSNGTIVLHASWADKALYPGGQQSVSFTADNAGASNLYVGTIHTASITTSDPGCLPADFSMADVVSNTEVPANSTGVALAGTGTLQFANTDVNQDSCKGATVTLHLTSN